MTLELLDVLGGIVVSEGFSHDGNEHVEQMDQQEEGGCKEEYRQDDVVPIVFIVSFAIIIKTELTKRQQVNVVDCSLDALGVLRPFVCSDAASINLVLANQIE